MAHVEPLQKISVAIRAGAAPGDMNLPLARPEVTFICGIGTGGMTPFEYLLAGRTPGDEISFRVTRPDMEQFFEHLAPAFAAPFKDRNEVHFQVRLTGIGPADGRAIVRAMAELTARAESGGCDCGCGCG
ncbi:MAG: hypothetical protein HY895_10690 [Deltaproteobacteria bacterium]|nr:hypothetical protein [Deltaproteobacteria bacterium]